MLFLPSRAVLLKISEKGAMYYLAIFYASTGY